MLKKYGARTFNGELLRINHDREFVTFLKECLGERLYVYDGQDPCEDGDASGLAYYMNGHCWKCKKYGARARTCARLSPKGMLTSSCALVAARNIPCPSAQRNFWISS